MDRLHNTGCGGCIGKILELDSIFLTRIHNTIVNFVYTTLSWSDLYLDDLLAEMFDIHDVLLRDLCSHRDLGCLLHLLLNLNDKKKFVYCLTGFKD